MTSTGVMRSVIWDGGRGVDVGERPIPVPGPRELVIQVGASGLCGTDLHIASGEYPYAQPNVVLGHEYAGTIAAVGSNAGDWAIGDRIVVDPNVPCGVCRFCRDAKMHLCVAPATLGVSTDGGLAEFSAVPAAQAYRVPDALPMAAAALTEPLACVIHAVDRAGLRPGNRAVVIGAGPIGLLTAAVVRASGASLVEVSDVSEMRRARVAEFGGIARQPDELADGEADVVLECVGKPATLASAIPLVKSGGTIVWVGVAAPDDLVPVPAYEVFRREITIRGTYTNPYTMDRALAMLASGSIPWESIITHRLSMDRFAEAWTAHRTGEGLKVLVEPSGNATA